MGSLLWHRIRGLAHFASQVWDILLRELWRTWKGLPKLLIRIVEKRKHGDDLCRAAPGAFYCAQGWLVGRCWTSMAAFKDSNDRKWLRGSRVH